MKRIWSFLIVAVLVGLAVQPSQSGTPSVPSKVKGTSTADESDPGASDTYLVWDQNSEARPRHFDAFREPLNHSVGPKKMNAARTLGFSGGLSGSEASFQEVTFGARVTHSNVYLYDVTTDIRSNPPAGVNTKDWEWSPSTSPGFILFGRNQFRTARSPWKVILYDRTNPTFKVLDHVKNRCGCIFPGTVTDQFATWTKCNANPCQAYYYDIVGGTTKRVMNPNDRQQYGPAASQDGDSIYYFRSGNACGKQVKLLRFDIWTVSPVLVAALSTGRDADGTFVFTDGLSSDHVYYGQFNCARSDFDIYVVDNAELLRGRGADGSDGRVGGGRPMGRGLPRPS